MNSLRIQTYIPNNSPSDSTSTTISNNLTEASAQAAGTQHPTSIPLPKVDPAVFRFGNRSVEHTPTENPYAGILEAFTCPITQEVVQEPVIAVPKNNAQGTQIPAHIYEAESIHAWDTNYREQNPYRPDVLDPTTKAPLYSAVRVHGLKAVVQTCIRNHDAWELEQTQFYKDTQLPHYILENPRLVSNFISTAQEFESMGALEAARDQHLEAFKYTQHTEVLEQYLAFLKRHRSAADLQLILGQFMQRLKSIGDTPHSRKCISLVVHMQKMHTVQPTAELIKYYESIYRTTHNRSVLKSLIHIYRYGPKALQSIAKQIELFYIDLEKNPNDLAAYGSYRRYLRAVKKHTAANAFSALHFEALKRKYPHSTFESAEGVSIHFERLSSAVQAQDIPAIKAVLANGINLNTKVPFGTLFRMAIETHNLESIQLLLDEGIDDAFPVGNSESFLNVAVSCRNLAVLKLLIEYGTYVNAPSLYMNAMMCAASMDYIDVLELLISAGADVNNPSSSGGTPLKIAASQGQLDSVKFLIAAGADVNLDDPIGRNALQLAALKSHIDIVDTLIKAGADVNHANDDGLTPLMIAIHSKNIHLIKTLLTAGVHKDAQDIHGNTALHLVTYNSSIEIIQILIQAGASVNILDQWNRTPLMNAVEAGDLEAVRLLTEAGASKDL